MKVGVSVMNNFIKRSWMPILLFGGLYVFLMSTNPHKLPIGWLLLPFLWIFVAIFYSLRIFLRVIRRRKKSKNSTTLALIGATLPTLLLILGSINQLTTKDVLRN